MIKLHYRKITLLEKLKYKYIVYEGAQVSPNQPCMTEARCTYDIMRADR